MKYHKLWCIAWLVTVAVASAQEGRLPKQVDLTPKFKELGLTVRTQFGRPSCGTFAITALAELESARGHPGSAPALSEEFLWWACDQAAGLKKDHSVLFQRVLNGLNTFGICTEALMPVGRGQKLSHYRGQIEPPASLPGGATVGCFGEVRSEER